jgi:capsular polysaccharide biosynthesis protein
MSQPNLLSRSVRTVRRHKILIGVVAAVGLLAGAGYGTVKPPLRSSTALVILPASAKSIATQVVIAESDPVLSAALPKVSPPVSLVGLRRDLHVKSVTSYVISITAQGKTAADAEATANAVADSYVAYITPSYSPVGHTLARILDPASNATGLGALAGLLIDAILGAVLGAVVGVVVALVKSRNDRRLRERDDIANSIGIPVLASIPVGHPSDAAGWTRLLDDYKPGPVDAWALRTALQQLGLADHTRYHGDGGGFSVAVLSLSSDPNALALGPQLAVAAASQGIDTELAFGPQQDANVTAALRAACATRPPVSSNRPGLLRVTVSNDGGVSRPSDSALIIAVVVVDVQEPKLPEAMRTTATVMGVSAAAATAEQLAKVAVEAAADGREISGFLVADPEPTDRTNGRIPRPSQPVRHRQARAKSIGTEIRR